MGKSKRKLNDLSILSTFVLLAVVFLLLAILLVEVERTLLTNAQRDIAFQYSDVVEGFNSEKVWGNQSVYLLSEHDGRMMWLYEMGMWTLPPFTYLACFILAGFVFYRSKIRRPLLFLTTSANRIAENDLDFSISYESKDELGRLCASFEIMRSALANNFAGMWRQVEERKQLNAAFAHDLRTPLTVLKGYDEMLQTSSDRITQETAVTMGKHILRLERYVDSMSKLQRLEDAQPVYAEVLWQEFSAALEENAYILCSKGSKKLLFQNRVTSKQLILDRSFVSQVCNNLISNAIRYADTTIALSVEETDGRLLLTVTDDGKGFSKETLIKAANPYFTEEKNHAEHFGLGLYICKLLCEHHGGYLEFKNLDNGAKAAAFFRSPNCR